LLTLYREREEFCEMYVFATKTLPVTEGSEGMDEDGPSSARAAVDSCEKSGSELRATYPLGVPGLVRDLEEKAERRTLTGAIVGDLASLFVEAADDGETTSDLGRRPGPLGGAGCVLLDSVTSDVPGASNNGATVYGGLCRLDDPPMPGPSHARRS
jgi:hypothetical protein